MEPTDSKWNVMMYEQPANEGNLQTMNHILSAMDNSLEQMIYDPEETFNLMDAKNIDLVKILNGNVYSAKITNNLWDVKKVIENIENVYEDFYWTKNNCGK